MKKVKMIFASLCIGGLMGSCVISHTAVVTNNPVGSKVGEIKGHQFKKDFDMSYEAAMKKGGITTIGIAEMRVKMFFIPLYNFKVTGE
ncbi:MAG: hypothetical protein COA38_06970 [Fluviicola sp.]|nr:MAG: hypothetical protein COA38_06970 [Fluviicola sp.]